MRSRPGIYGGKPSVFVYSPLGWQFDVEALDRVWVADITNARTLKRFTHLAIVIDRGSHRVID